MSCNKESLDLQEHQTELSNNYRTTLFNVTESSELYKELGEIVKKVKFDVSPSGTAKTAFWIDYSNIIKLIDSVGNITYAVKIRADKESDKVFYNLILTERTNGKVLDPFILRYEHGIEVTRATYRNSVNKRFKGKISSFSIESFVLLKANLVGKDGAFDPCWQDTVDQNLGDTVGDSGSSSGSGTSGSGGSDSGGFTSTGTTGVTSGTIPTDSSGSTTYTTGGTKGTVTQYKTTTFINDSCD